MTASLRRLAALVSVLALGAAAGASLAGQAAPVEAQAAWVRLPAPSKTETAAYMVIVNHGSSARAVVAVSCEQAATAEMHEMRMDGKLMRMNQIQRIDVPANGKTTLAPNGLHVMLLGLKSHPAVGNTMQLTLTLDDGTKVPVTATVRK